jgi:hypothetical protein
MKKSIEKDELTNKMVLYFINKSFTLCHYEVS